MHGYNTTHAHPHTHNHNRHDMDDMERRRHSTTMRSVSGLRAQATEHLT